MELNVVNAGNGSHAPQAYTYMGMLEVVWSPTVTTGDCAISNSYNGYRLYNSYLQQLHMASPACPCMGMLGMHNLMPGMCVALKV